MLISPQKYYSSYVDKETLKPIKFVRDTNEDGYTTYEEIRFNHDTKTASSKKGKTKETLKSMDIKMTDCAFDIVSILYYLRNIDLNDKKVGDKIPMNIVFEEKEYSLYVEYLGLDTVKVRKQGKFKCHKVSPLVIAGDYFTETDQMKIWVTADDNKIPVLIESPIKVGKIKAVIAGSENLKYPLTSKQ